MLKSNLNKSTRKAKTGKSKSAHGIPEHIIRNLQTHIKDAAFAIVQNGHLSLISNERVKTLKEENAPLLIGINPNGAVDGKPTNEVKTIYGVDNFNEWLCRRAKEGRVLVGNVKKAEALLRDVGIQFSQPVAYADDLMEFILALANKIVNTSDENIQYALAKDAEEALTADGNARYSMSETNGDGRQYAIGRGKGVANEEENNYNNTSNIGMGGAENGRKVAGDRYWRLSQKHTGK